MLSQMGASRQICELLRQPDGPQVVVFLERLVDPRAGRQQLDVVVRRVGRDALGPDHRRAQLADRAACRAADRRRRARSRPSRRGRRRAARGRPVRPCGRVMYLAMSSRPWIVPASARYELVDMIASGLSKTRDSTSPGRMPPRARQRIWSNSQPDACDLQRQALDQHVVLVPGDVEVFAVVGQHAVLRLAGLSSTQRLRPIGMAQQDRVLAVGAGRDHVDRRADEGLRRVRDSAARSAAGRPSASSPNVLSVQPGNVS